MILEELDQQFRALFDAGKYEEALPFAQEALRIREETLGPEHPDTVQSLDNLANVFACQGDFARAEPLWLLLLQAREQILGPNHPDTARSLNNLGGLYANRGEHAKAEPLFQRLLQIHEQTLGPDHPDTVESLYLLATLYYATGDYAKAEPLLQRALKSREDRLGADHPDTAVSLHRLAVLYRDAGELRRAEALWQRVLHIREETLGADHPETAATLNNLARVYVLLGDYAKAEPLYHRSLQIKESAFGPDNSVLVGPLYGLALLYWPTLGDHLKAEPLYERVLRIAETVFGPDHPIVGFILGMLALIFLVKDEHAKAEPLVLRASQILESAFGPEDPRASDHLSLLASFHLALGEYAKAEPLLIRSLQIEENAFGPDSVGVATGVTNLAALYLEMGDYAKAEPLYHRTLQVSERSLGSKHRWTGWVLQDLAMLLAKMGKDAEAGHLAVRACDIERRILSEILSFTSEQQRLAYQQKCQPYDLFATLGNATNLALTVLRNKGVVLDSLLEDRLVAEASPEPSHRALVSQLRAAKHRLGQFLFEPPDPAVAEQRKAEQARLENEVERIEKELARYVAGLGRARRALSVTVEQVHVAIPPGAVLVEFIKYGHILKDQPKPEPRYGGVLLASSGEPRWVMLGVASEIEEKIDRYQAAVRGQDAGAGMISSPPELSGTPSTGQATTPSPLTPSLSPADGGEGARRAGEGLMKSQSYSVLLRVLYDRLWAPIELVLPPGTHTVILSPDGALNRVSFATLLTPDDRFLSQKHAIRYVTSGRDLLPGAGATEQTGPMSVFADPDFSGGASSGTGSPGKTTRAVRSLSPGSQRLGSPAHEPQDRPLTPSLSPPRGEGVRRTGEGSFRGAMGVPSSGSSQPGPLPEERETFSGGPVLTSDSGLVQPPSAVLPLPKGEGRGEGEGNIQSPATPAASPRQPPATNVAEPCSRGTEAGTLREMERRDFGTLSLPPLPGTARESAALAEKALQWNWPTELHLAAEASEARLKATRSPRILHLATHGFFLPEEEPKSTPFGEAAFNLLSPHSFESALRTPHSALDDWRGVGGIRPELSLSQSGPFGLPGVPSLGSFGFRLGLVKNPMHRSGLALAGAQATLEAWRRGETPPPDNDGIVTAADVGTLDLKGTWLVTLSACDTGVGEVRSGEGVLGLRRAFIQAGAENLLMTLWPIADEETAQFMVEFYDAAHRSGDAPRALWEVQRDWLVKVREERGLQAAVSLAGPFVMTSQEPR